MNSELLGKKENYGLWYELFKIALKGMNIDLLGDIYSSGEENICNILSDLHLTEIFFDVGANIGKYTTMLKESFPNAMIYCFEPAVETFRILKDNIGEKENIVLNNIAISDTAGKGKLYYDKETSGLASLYKRQLDYFNMEFSKSEEVSIETLDTYCKKNNIDHIDFLKLDIEGNELRALRGGERLLKKKRIYAIQIEFGGCNIDSRTYFRDFWNLLHEDYYAYRILKNGIWKITNYTEKLECFCNTNYFFVLKELDKEITHLVDKKIYE